jgi:hypothetical protein
MKVMNVFESEKFLKSRVDIAKSLLIKNEKDLVKVKKLKFPLILKVVSDKALHKTDVGGVVKVNSERGLVPRYEEIVKTLNKKLKGKKFDILAQEFVEGEQLFIGINEDPVFGHVIGIGLGGIAIEALHDVQFRMCPVNEHDVDSMLNNLQMKGLIFNSRNKLNLKEFKKQVIKVSQLPQRYPKIKELDINPVILNSKQSVVVDARIIWN